ncbi:MAG TPA: carboxymuconolactone decarboxylase family protein [Candidatus Binatia bacterium]|jgi:alkylhydroperoxidase family enzyme|nr:carboxymuconolactone decarboxylase family protein [Candidatus Binatia bacterium]
MPYIRTIRPSEATGKLKEIYESGSGPSAARGKVSMIRQVQSLNPNALAAWRALDVEIMRGESRITRRQREMIATVVSATNHCSY